MAAVTADVQEIRITVVKGVNPGSKISFEPGLPSIRIGRAVDNEIVISDPTVSRHHARIDASNMAYTLCDAGSAAGVEKMGFRVGQKPEPLESGDEFKLGDTILRFELVGPQGVIRPLRQQKPVAAAVEKQKPSLPPVGDLLARIGLRTRSMQLVAGVCLVLIAWFVLFPKEDALPPQAPSTPLPLRYDSVVGFTQGDVRHLDGATFEIPNDAEGVGLYFRLYTGGGVEILTGDRVAAKVERGKSWRSCQLLVIPRAIAKDGKATVTFDNLAWSPADGDVEPDASFAWGLRSMWPALVKAAPATSADVAHDLEALSSLSDHLDDDPVNRYALAKGLRADAIGLMKLVGRTSVLAIIPGSEPPGGKSPRELVDGARASIDAAALPAALDQLVTAIQVVDSQLNREYQRYRNAALVAKQKGVLREQRSAWESVLRVLPELTDPRNRAARTELRLLGVPG